MPLSFIHTAPVACKVLIVKGKRARARGGKGTPLFRYDEMPLGVARHRGEAETIKSRWNASLRERTGRPYLITRDSPGSGSYRRHCCKLGSNTFGNIHTIGTVATIFHLRHECDTRAQLIERGDRAEYGYPMKILFPDKNGK